MRILACFLLCSMMGGVSEVIFIAAKNFIKGRFGRTTRESPDGSASRQERVPSVIDGVPTMETNAVGVGSEQA